MTEERDYIANCNECGHTVGWHAGGPDAGKDVGRWIAAGLNIERCATDEAKARPWGHATTCSHYRKPKPVQKTFA